MKTAYLKNETELAALFGHDRRWLMRRRKAAEARGIAWPERTARGYNVEKVQAALDAVEAEGEAESTDTRSAREALALAQTELVRLKIARLKGTMIPREEHLAKLGAVAGLVNRFFDAMKQTVETETRDPAACALVERIIREKAAELAAKVKT